jgi:hypothetical protein
LPGLLTPSVLVLVVVELLPLHRSNKASIRQVNMEGYHKIHNAEVG